jgi:hypothetical protein
MWKAESSSTSDPSVLTSFLQEADIDRDVDGGQCIGGRYGSLSRAERKGRRNRHSGNSVVSGLPKKFLKFLVSVREYVRFEASAGAWQYESGLGEL